VTGRTVVLVTGGTGHIGARVVLALRRRQVDVVVYDRRPRPERLGTVAESVRLVAGDIADERLLGEVLIRYGVTHVIHTGAVLGFESARDAKGAIEANCIGTAAVFELAERHELSRVVWASSTGLYGTRRQYEHLLGRHVVDESDPPMPATLYAATKQLNETLAAMYRSRGVDVVALRPVLTYGWGAFATAAGIVNAALRDLALTGRAFVGDPWARDSRINAMHVDDCAELFVELCLRDRALEHGVYNAGTGEYASIGEMLGQAAELVGGAEVRFESDSPAGPSSAGIPLYDFPDVDSTRIRSEWGWQPRYRFAAGAEAVMAEARAHGRTAP